MEKSTVLKILTYALMATFTLTGCSSSSVCPETPGQASLCKAQQECRQRTGGTGLSVGAGAVGVGLSGAQRPEEESNYQACVDQSMSRQRVAPITN